MISRLPLVIVTKRNIDRCATSPELSGRTISTNGGTMDRRKIRISIALFSVALFIVAIAPLALAQPHIRVPQASPHAIAAETVGITDISVDYHRPSVNNRRIFGGLVPYDVIWRAGEDRSGDAEARLREHAEPTAQRAALGAAGVDGSGALCALEQ